MHSKSGITVMGSHSRQSNHTCGVVIRALETQGDAHVTVSGRKDRPCEVA